MATSQHRCVFVGNIPYDATEEQLIQICEEVGPVVSFRLVIDRETGKPKGYGFCEYKDEETALSARRNLLGYEINGRQLRVDFAENDKGADRNREQGRGGPGMVANADTQKQPRGLGDSSLQPIGLPLAMAAASVMAGTLGGAQIGTNRSNQNRLQNQLGLGSDPLTLHLAKMSRNQLNEILSELKVMATQNRELARQLLLSNPQLSKALFQTEIMLGMVSPQMLQMPNISQAPSTLSQPLIQEGQQFKQSSIQTLPGVTPPTQSNLQFGLVPKVQSGQMPAVPQASPQQILQLGNQVLHTLPSNSIRPQLLGQFPVRPQTQLETSSSLKQQMQPPFPQQPTVQVGGTNLGHYNQMATSNAAGQPLAVHPPPFQEMGFKPSATSSGIPVTVKKEADGSTRVADDAIRVGRTNAYSSMIHDISEPMNRPPKLAKLDDGRSSSFSVGLPGPAASGQSQAFGISSLSGSQNSAPDEEQPSQNQLQLAPEVESALLQQVMNLTPEQLSSLPPEQRQQVMQLQQMLR